MNEEKKEKKCAVSNVSVSACVICIRIPTKSMWLSCAMDVSKNVFFSLLKACTLLENVCWNVLYTRLYISLSDDSSPCSKKKKKKNVTVRLASSMCVCISVSFRRRFSFELNFVLHHFALMLVGWSVRCVCAWVLCLCITFFRCKAQQLFVVFASFFLCLYLLYCHSEQWLWNRRCFYLLFS